MKKITLICFVFSAFAIFFHSCKDTSGDYIENLYTKQDLQSICKECLYFCKDTAISHLCIPGGFSTTTYAITLPNNNSYKMLRDTMVILGKADLIDSLQNSLNLSCEAMGNAANTALKNAIKTCFFENPRRLSSSSNTSITTYFSEKKATEIQTSLQSTLEANMVTTGAITWWNTILNTYNSHVPTQPLYDLGLTTEVLQQLTNALFQEMKAEEILISTDPSHRITSNLQNIFK